MKISNIKINKLLIRISLVLLLISVSCGSQIDKSNNSGNIRFEEQNLTSVAITSEASEREKLAANELISYLYKVTGKHLPLKSISNSGIPDGVIAVGSLAIKSGLISKSELGSVKSDGFVIKVTPKKAGICGWRDLGTLYGVYEFLNRFGVKFYAQDCEVIPHIADLKLSPSETSIKPRFDMRAIFKLDVYYHGLKPSPKLGYTPNDDMGYPGDLGEFQERNWVHSASFLVPYRKYGKDHPEYFALQKDGQRYKPGMGPGGHLCLSNENMRKVSAERLLYLIDKQKDRSFFVVTQGDGRSNCWCQCNSCKALDSIPGDHMTDRLLDYVNYNARAVAKKYPDKKILTLAYTDASSRPPAKILPDSNVMVMYCTYPYRTMCHSHGLDCPKNSLALEDLKGWLAKCPNNMYIFDYPRGYSVWYEPFGSFYAMVSKMNFYSEVGIRGVIDCVVPTTFRDLLIFVQGKLFWNPKANVESLIDEFMSAYYGSAALEMRNYLNFMKNQIDSRSIHQMCEAPNPDLVSPEYAYKALAIFKRAQAAVAKDSIRLKRVQTEKFCVLWSDINQRNTINEKLSISLDEYRERFVEMVRIARNMKILQIGPYETNNLKTWLQKVAEINLQSEPWYEDPGVDLLISHPEFLFAN